MTKEQVLAQVRVSKTLRQQIDQCIQFLKEQSNREQPECRASRERSLALTKAQEAVMWLGMDLKAIAEENPSITELSNPYPHSKNPASTVVDKTADGLKL